MSTHTCIVDNRNFLMGLDEMYRELMKEHERGELLTCARAVCETLGVEPATGPVEGYYTEDEGLTEYFQRMRALQCLEMGQAEAADASITAQPEYCRLRDVLSAPLYGEAVWEDNLLPTGFDPLSKALRATYPDWDVEALTAAARAIAIELDDFSLVGLAAFANDSVVLAGIRESVVLYAAAIAMAAMETPTYVYKWEVDPALAERATEFICVFNKLFDDNLPLPVPDNAQQYWEAAYDSDLIERCVRLGKDHGAHYHWAVTGGLDGLAVCDFCTCWVCVGCGTTSRE